MWRTILLSSTLALVACVPGNAGRGAGGSATPAHSPAQMSGDTLRGIVEIVGSEPGTWVVLRIPASGGRITLHEQRRVLGRLAGLEVMVAGVPAGDQRFSVQRVAVRSANGVPAVDGKLILEDRQYFLLAASGERLRIAYLPEALRGSVGARVWLAGPLDREPDSSGIIESAQ